MIDTHAHLDFEQLESDLEAVVGRFLKNNGKAIVNIGVDTERIEKTAELSKKYRQIYAAIGFHPEEADKLAEFDYLAFLEKFLDNNSKIVAIGEVGLDYFHSKDAGCREKQKELLQKQLDFVCEKKLPVVLHCRDAYEDMLKIISKKEYRGTKKVLHCYSGEPKDTEKFLELGNLFFSFTGNITFPKKETPLLKSVEMIPLKKIMVETDCPFLAPHPHRGERNEPANVRHVLEKLAEIKKIDFREAEQKTDENAVKFFQLPINI